MDRLLQWANGSLLFSVVALVVTVVMAYPLAEMFALGVQILAHIGTLLFATGIKVAYVARLVALKALGRPIH